LRMNTISASRALKTDKRIDSMALPGNLLGTNQQYQVTLPKLVWHTGAFSFQIVLPNDSVYEQFKKLNDRTNL
jgi:hypothetical protein